MIKGMYTLDYRQRVLAIKVSKKLTFEETSEQFEVGIATLFRWAKRITPMTTRNKPATKINMKRLKKDVEKNPDAYQWERAKRFKVTSRTIGYALKRLGITYKKNSVASQSGRKGAYEIPKKNKTV